jgi:hypothetical protein
MTLTLFERNDLLNIVEIVDVIEWVEAARKPAMYGNLTFYGDNDQWMFTAFNGPNTCEVCGEMDGDTFYGYDLRSFFKYHVIVDENTVAAKVHPHCPCTLSRVFNVEY